MIGMKYDLVIFDLDGTTLATLTDLADAANRTLAGFGFPTQSNDKIRTCIGSGMANLIRQAAPEGTPEEVIQQMLTQFKADYAENINVRTAPYPGVSEMMKVLRSAGVKIAVNSNKIDSAVNALCEAHFPGLYEFALGERAEIPRKPSPAGAQMIMQKLGAVAERTLYVGDSNIDLLTAANAGIDCAWVSWGFRSREELSDLKIDHAFDTAEELTAFILG